MKKHISFIQYIVYCCPFTGLLTLFLRKSADSAALPLFFSYEKSLQIWQVYPFPSHPSFSIYRNVSRKILLRICNRKSHSKKFMTPCCPNILGNHSEKYYLCEGASINYVDRILKIFDPLIDKFTT